MRFVLVCIFTRDTGGAGAIVNKANDAGVGLERLRKAAHDGGELGMEMSYKTHSHAGDEPEGLGAPVKGA